MLVLTRRAEETLVFPNLGITLSVLRVTGKVVKLGVDAPPDVKVLRSELPVHADAEGPAEEGSTDSETLHRIRNELNAVRLGLRLLQAGIEKGVQPPSAEAFDRLVDQAAGLDRRVAGLTREGATERPRRLLVVEDADNERALMANLLALYGFDVYVARDGQEAIERLEREPLPDFVLLDCNMPVATGPETLRRIRDDDRLQHLKVFAVTGSEQPTRREEPRERWDGWFSKPLDVDRLLATLQSQP
ncbi:MAG TPA: response regulator [Pirellulaceae bacterium]|nr:response regulator [Pirellulaceae bacterium]